MATIYDSASLVMIPSGVKEDKLYSIKPTDGSGDFTFERGSDIEATRVNSSGLIEKAKVNLLTYSNDFSDADWVNVGASPTSGQSGYDGSSDAWLLERSDAFGRLIQTTSAFSNVSTLSIYAKAGSYNFLRLALQNVAHQVYFDLSSGTIGTSTSNIDATIEAVSGGWYRCTATFQTASAISVYVQPVETDGGIGNAGTGNIYIQDAQLNYGLVAQDYVDTTTTSVVEGLTADLPRLDYSGGASCPSLLLEPSRTNLILHSEYTDGTNWSNEGSIIDEENTSETTSPEGVYNAVKLVSANATSEQWIQCIGVSVTSGNDCTTSCFVKKSDYDYFHIRFTGVGSAFTAGSIWYDIANGTLGTAESGITGTIEDYGNGWYRISATKEAIATAFGAVRFQLASSDNIDAVVGDGSKGTYAYGFQAEIGSYPTSYIPTYGTSAGRGDELMSNTNNILANATNMSMFIDYTLPTEQDTTFRNQIGYRDNVNADFYMVQFANSNQHEFRYRGTTGVNVDMTPTIDEATYGLRRKIAYTKNGTTLKVFCNGVEVSSVTNANATTFSPSNEDLVIGSNYPPELNVSQLLVFPTALTDAEAIALTTL